MRYLPLTDKEREEIKKTLNIKETRELFYDIPQEKSYFSLNDLPSSLSEQDLIKKFREISQKNRYQDYISFLGAGAYNHFIPEVVNYLSGKGEFLTPYTPYQPEVSQGSLQAMFEYQTMLTLLTGLDVSNSSLYDGGTAAAEGILLALRKSRKNRILIASNIHPEYIEIMRTYIQNLDYEIELVNFDPVTGKIKLNDLEKKINENIGGFIFQSPNFFGVVEDGQQISEIAHRVNSYSIQVVSEAMSLAFLTPPGKNGVDIVVGEAQSFGLPLGFGGPYLGFIVTTDEFIRQMPGRIVGQTVDVEGNRGYVLTLSTREQHIRRERATSNICTNQAWCGVRAGIYLAAMGKKGLEKISKINHLNTAYFVREINRFKHVQIKYKTDFYSEVVLEVSNHSIEEFSKKLEQKNILIGVPLKWFYSDYQNAVLVNFTEMHEKEDIDHLIQSIGELQ